MKENGIKHAASVLGRKGYRARLKKYGLTRIQQIARENGKKGGRPRSNKKAKR